MVKIRIQIAGVQHDIGQLTETQENAVMTALANVPECGNVFTPRLKIGERHYDILTYWEILTAALVAARAVA